MTTFLLPLLLTLLLALTLLSSTTAQFGVGKKKGGAKSAFEQAQERAGTNGNVGIANRKQKGGANGGANGGATSTGDPDVDALMAELTAGMSTEELQQMEALMESMGDMDLGAAMGDMQEVFSAMADMDPDELVGMVHEAMQTPEVQEMLKDPAAMLEVRKKEKEGRLISRQAPHSPPLVHTCACHLLIHVYGRAFAAWA